MAKKRQANSTIDDAALNELALSLARTVRDEGSLKFPAIVRAGVPKAQLDDAIAKLEEAGLEVVTKKKVVRVPISEQIGALLAEGAVRKAKDIVGGVAGATKKEVDLAIAALVKQGKAHWVVRTKELLLMGESDDLLTAAELDTIERAITSLTNAMKLARKRRATLLRNDVEKVLPRLTKATAQAETHKTQDAEEDLSKLVDRHREKTGLTFVPTLVRALGGKRARDEVHAALLKGARSGIFELRPESGLARLTAEDVSFCIPGPQGSKLSWVRRLDS